MVIFRIKRRSGLSYDDMLFFDDEDRNIQDMRKLGVTSILVPEAGISIKLVEEGFAEYAKQHTNKSST